MTYKGYLGTVNYSDKDQVFYGKIDDISRFNNLLKSIGMKIQL